MGEDGGVRVVCGRRGRQSRLFYRRPGRAPRRWLSESLPGSVQHPHVGVASPTRPRPHRSGPPRNRCAAVGLRRPSRTTVSFEDCCQRLSGDGAHSHPPWLCHGRLRDERPHVSARGIPRLGKKGSPRHRVGRSRRLVVFVDDGRGIGIDGLEHPHRPSPRPRSPALPPATAEAAARSDSSNPPRSNAPASGHSAG